MITMRLKELFTVRFSVTGPGLIVILTLLIFVQACMNKGSSDEAKPNIIFILTDDQRWDALGYAGNPIIQTPHMDELASSGLYFKNAFVTTPICAASRATLFTGLYERTHNYTFGKPPLHDRYMYQSYPYLLRKAGYSTGFIGKFGVKVNEGIQDSLFTSMIPTWYPYFVDVDGKQVHLADIHGDHAIDFIKANKEQPFCLSLSFWSPHANDDAEEQYFWPASCDSLYADVKIPEPETAEPAFFEALPEFLKTTMNRKRWYWRYDTPEKYQQMVKGYYKMISGVDGVIGRIRASLEEEGLAENTVIILMGDNGYYLGERGYAGKWLMHEPSLRVPMIIFDPRQAASDRSRTLEEMVLNLDVTPTILSLAGVGIPDIYQGESLTAFYRGAPEKWRSSIFCEHLLEDNDLLPKTECFRDDTWKFIRYEAQDEIIELYNHQEDIHEIHNLSLDEQYADKIEYYKHVCDSIASSLLSDRIGGI
jgi:arylsulfatase A-like enzyme